MLILMVKFVPSRKGQEKKKGKGKLNLSGEVSLKSCQMWQLDLSLVIAVGQTDTSGLTEDIISTHLKSFSTCCFYCGYFYTCFIPHSSILKQIISIKFDAALHDPTMLSTLISTEFSRDFLKASGKFTQFTHVKVPHPSCVAITKSMGFR